MMFLKLTLIIISLMKVSPKKCLKEIKIATPVNTQMIKKVNIFHY